MMQFPDLLHALRGALLPLIGGLLAPPPALATLGEPLGRPAGTANATHQLLAVRGGVQSREITLENGSRLMEYADGGGMVFAVRWDGPTLPDLPALLGRYFGAFRSAAQARRGVVPAGTPFVVQGPEVVVQSRGRMRQFAGFAYVPTLVPSNVVIADVLR